MHIGLGFGLFQRTGVSLGLASFYLNLSNATNSTIADAQGSGTIIGGSITIPSAASIMSRSSGKEMLSVHFDASGTTHSTITNPEHELFYAWDFGDEVGETWDYGTDTTRSKNVAYGPQAAHVYKDVGTFTWTLYIVDGAGGSATRTGTVTTSAWTEAETYYIDNGAVPVAGVNGVGSGAAGYLNYSSWTSVVSLMAANPGKRIRLKRGASWTTTGAVINNALTLSQLDDYGTGAVPLITSSGASVDPIVAFYNGSVYTYADIRFSNIKLAGGTLDAAGAMGIYSQGLITNLLLHSVEISGSLEAIQILESDGLCIAACNVHDIGLGYTTWVSGNQYYSMYIAYATRFALIGTNSNGNHTGHNIRLPGVAKGTIANSTIIGARGYDGPGETIGVSGGYGHVITLRGFENSPLGTWSGLWTEKVVIRDNYIGSTYGVIDGLQIAAEGDYDASRHRNIIVECNYFSIVGVNPGGGLMQAINTEVSSNLTIRNNIMVIADGREAIMVFATTDVGAPLPSDTKIYNNTVWKTGSSAFTFVNMRTDPGPTAGTTGTVIKNNLVYAPSASSPLVAASNGSYTSTWTESNNSTPTQMTTTRPWAANPPVAYVDYAPNSYGINAGTSVSIIKDFFNVTITGTREIGAIQV